eukprot:COSAG02_NODE_10994_length_1815_cov_1.544872_2_plen_59_part_00
MCLGAGAINFSQREKGCKKAESAVKSDRSNGQQLKDAEFDPFDKHTALAKPHVYVRDV